ncbi:MAG: 4-hydroxyphenylpyruvate dioxygenase [Pirellulaceae bacterium]|nr:4-hydroxyphenylpyruvate dioxygenase [Pirellulaceae bacterium]
MNSHTSPELDPSRAHINPLGLRSIDHIEFIVDNADEWADYHVQCMGMQKRAYGDESTGLKGRRAFVVGQGRVNFIFAEPQGDSPEANQLRAHFDKHGNGVKDIAFRVKNAANSLKTASESGATVVRDLDVQDGFQAGSIAAYGDTIHTFLERDRGAPFAPGYQNIPGGIEDSDIHFMMIDHVVANVEDMDQWCDYYRKIFGFDQLAHFNIDTGRSSLMSKVMKDNLGYIKLPINEPSSENSQIQLYLDDYKGPGVQHIALLTSNIITAISEMRSNGVDFLHVPDTYFEELPGRVGEIEEPLDKLQENGILVDRDRPDGYLLQLFTKPIFERPTLFYEVIQRKGNSDGFGEGNFQALFEAIEREQERRGLL